MLSRSIQSASRWNLHGKIKRLERFLDSLLPAQLSRDTDEMVKARCAVAVRRKQYAELFSMIQSRNFLPKNHAAMQRLWNKGHYAEAQYIKGKKLKNVDKFLIRGKYPFPSTIWDGDKTSYGIRLLQLNPALTYIKESSKIILNAAFWANPLPNRAAIEAIATDAKMTLAQVTNWCKNHRQRHKQKRDTGSTNQHHSEMAPKSVAIRIKVTMVHQIKKRFLHSGNIGNEAVADRRPVISII